MGRSTRDVREASAHRERESTRDPRRVSPKNVMNYYKSFSKKPSTFKEMYVSDNDKYSSSSDEGGSSSEDFPAPSSPHKKAYKRDDDDYGTLFSKVNELQRRLYTVELKQRKKAAQKR
jgi:hypothetical protein